MFDGTIMAGFYKEQDTIGRSTNWGQDDFERQRAENIVATLFTLTE
ncbi:MAG: hypothetical protein AAF334_04535 [Pseudomonadota bacterium]